MIMATVSAGTPCCCCADFAAAILLSARAPWLRAAVMGINDGLVSTASLMLGVGAGAESLRTMQVTVLSGT
jgi:hypothetical protein